MAPVAEWETLDRSKVQKAVTAMVPTEWYVNGEAYFTVEALPAVELENLSVMSGQRIGAAGRACRVAVVGFPRTTPSTASEMPCFFRGLVQQHAFFLQHIAHDTGASGFSRSWSQARNEEVRDRHDDQMQRNDLGSSFSALPTVLGIPGFLDEEKHAVSVRNWRRSSHDWCRLFEGASRRDAQCCWKGRGSTSTVRCLSCVVSRMKHANFCNKSLMVNVKLAPGVECRWDLHNVLGFRFSGLSWCFLFSFVLRS